MTYAIKRLREEGHFRLCNLDGVESLDVFWAEVNKVARLYIEDTGVYVAPTKNKTSKGEFIGFTCLRNADYLTRLAFVGNLDDDIALLRSVAVRVLCLPETNPQSMELRGSLTYLGRPGDKYDHLLLTTEQLRHIICAFPSRQYTFRFLCFTPKQSVELVSHRKFAIEVHSCQFEDKGQAMVDWLEKRNGAEIIDSCYFPDCDCVEKILKFLSRSMYPVFEKLYVLTGRAVFVPELSHLISAANIKTVMADIRFFSCCDGWRAPLLKALREGTFRPQTLEICFSSHRIFDEGDIPIIGKVVRKLLKAISSPDCTLKELHLKHFEFTEIAHDFERYLLNMLQTNERLEVLGVYSTLATLEFPQIKIMDAATKHPRLRKMCFYPPTSHDPPEVGYAEPFQVWVQKNRCHIIQFNDFTHSDKKPYRSKWQNAVFAVFTSEFDALQQVEDDKARSYLLATAIAIFQQMPDRIYNLLTGNLDVFAN
jgi:hypothetical protein